MTQNLTLAVITVVLSVLTSAGSWGMLQHLLTRSQRKKDEERKQREDEQAEETDRLKRQEAEFERRQLLAEAQETAQHTALASADARYNALHTDYNSCRDALISVRDAASLLINVFEGFLVRLRPNDEGVEYTAVMQVGELGEARRAVNEARRQLR